MAEKKLTRKEKQQQAMQNRSQVFVAKKQTVSGQKLAQTLGLLLAVIAFVLYLNTLGHDYTHDDFSVIKENTVVTQGPGAIPTILSSTYRYGYQGMNDGTYRPLSLIMFAIEWSFAPDSPGLGHFINVLLYALTAWLLFSLLVKLMKNYNMIIPFITTLLFIVHPLHSEVVASIKSRDEIMCFLLCLLVLRYVFIYMEEKKTSQLVIAALCFFLALLSKETAITMLAIIPLTIFFFSGNDLSKSLKTTAAFLIPAVIFLAIRAKIIGGGDGNAIAMADNVIAGAPNIVVRMSTAFHVLGQYIKLLIFPVPMLSDYSLNVIPLVKFSDLFSIGGLLFHVGIGIYAIKKFMSKDIVAYAILFYLVTLALFSNVIILIGATMAERFIYFPSLGYCLAIAVLLGRLTKTDMKEGFSDAAIMFKANIKLFAIVGTAGLAYSFMTVDRNADWKNNYTLYSKDVVTGKESYRMHYYYGRTLIKDIAPAEADTNKRKLLFDEGIAEMKEAIRILPTYSDAHSQLGVAYTRINRFDKAIESYEAGIKLNPNDAIGINNMASVFFSQGRMGDAINAYNNVIRLNPRYVDAYVNLGSCYGTLKEFNNAISAFQKALAIEPTNTKALMYISQTYGFMGDAQNAQLYYDKAVQIDPSLKK